MNVLVFSLAYDPFIGGAEIAVGEIARRLPHINFDIITLRLDSKLPSHHVDGNVAIYRIGFSRANPAPADFLKFPLYLNKVIYPVLAAWKASRLLKKKKYDCMWSIMTYMALPAYFVRKFVSPVPYIITLQDGDTVEHITKRQRIKPFAPLLRNSFAGATVIQAISKFLAEYGRDMGYAGEPIVIPNGVDTAVFTKEYSAAELAEVRHSIDREAGAMEYPGTSEIANDVMLVTVSRLVKKNGVGDIIAALRLLPPYVRLLILGDGPDLTPLKTRTSELGLDKRVLFLGSIPNEEVPKYLAVSDIFVRPSLSEGLGTSFLEAMAAGLPVIATPVGGIPDFLFDPHTNPDREPTGLFCEPENPESVAAKVTELIENPMLRETIARNGRTLALSRYDWQLIAERMEKEVFSAMVRTV